MSSLRRHEGYLLIDDSASGGRKAELPTVTCSHCQQIFMRNPARTRERAYCPKCDHYLCDNCGAIRAMNGGQCRTFKQLIDQTQEAAVRQAQRGSIIIPA